MKLIITIAYLFHLFYLSFAIDCNEVISRAKTWVDRGVPYSMSKYTSAPGGGSYRTDCSGFVSMAWKLGTSMSTVTLPQVAKKISKNDLRKGDIIMKGGSGSAGAAGHVVIFEKWADAGKTKYWAYEQTPPKAIHRTITYPYFGRSGYVPYRYNKITCGGGGGGSNPPPSGGCTCCKGNALGEYCGHELCGSGCIKDHIYGCNKKNAAPSMKYGKCSKGCTGSTNGKAKCNK